MMMRTFKARSPAKLILSGEHSVVYGKPAIAMAIDRYAESTVLSGLSSVILFNCLNLKYAKSFTLQTLKILKKQLHEQYHAFLEGRCGIRDVLKKPFELMQYTVTHLLESWNVSLSEGLEIRASSNIPIGCGMGSSAALVMSTLYALMHFLKLEIDPVKILSLGREAENLQHGFSSGLDLHLAMAGGCLRFQEGRTVARSLPPFPLAIAQTGKPRSTTGQCVSVAGRFFKKNPEILNDFAEITEAFDKALVKGDLTAIQTCVRENHKLLVKVGVVPPKVQAFIQAIEEAGGAAKICGAGGVTGENAGVVLVVSDRDLSQIGSNYGYPVSQVTGDMQGTHVV